mmetsp:Transcript_25618/g.59670  ORF Transcript_25618/g.59670 Transcript_25618/m.59670 type:complete len:943 (+) Transcript_25618:61-2889(+)
MAAATGSSPSPQQGEEAPAAQAEGDSASPTSDAKDVEATAALTAAMSEKRVRKACFLPPASNSDGESPTRLPGSEIDSEAPLSPVACTRMWSGSCSSKLGPAGANIEEEELMKFREYLHRFGLNPDKFGKGKSKPLELLYNEIYNQEQCHLEESENALRRVVGLVKIHLIVCMEGVDWLLVSTMQVLHDKRTRSMKQLLLWKLVNDQTWEDGIRLALQHRLRIEPAMQESFFHVEKETYRYKEESEISRGYPGLPTLYKIHEVVVQVKDPHLEEMEALGLPDLRGFATMEGLVGTRDVSARLNCWQWEDIKELERQGVVDNGWKQKRSNSIVKAASAVQPDGVETYRVQVPEPLERCPQPEQASNVPNEVLVELIGGKTTDWALIDEICSSLRRMDYNLSAFHQDCVKAFPELRLYLGPAQEPAVSSTAETPRRQNGRPSTKTTSGITSEDEYQRTMGALFHLYWLMRLDIDGKVGFCFGVDPSSDTWQPNWPFTPPQPCTKPFPQMSKEEKQAHFFCSGQWTAFQELLLDAGLLCRTDDGMLKQDHERLKAMLALTAVHDIMKMEALLPQVNAPFAPFGAYQEGETISDHDIALAYLMENFPSLVPSFDGLPAEARRAALFTQSKMDFNNGWLVQAEGPPGKVLRGFKKVLRGRQDAVSQVTPRDVAFYFVHWLTDLAGAVPTPLAGSEKFVVQFPHAVLSAFLQSFPVVKNLAEKDETAVFEEYLRMRWNMAPDLPLLTESYDQSGAEVICKRRLLCMAQAAAPHVLETFELLHARDRRLLSEEMARTGLVGQVYDLCRTMPHEDGGERWDQGPAFLLYYGPAFLQKAGAQAKLALEVLTSIYEAGRVLWPLTSDDVDKTVTLRMDTLKERSVVEACAASQSGEVWVLVRHNNAEGFVEWHTPEVMAELEKNGQPCVALRLQRDQLDDAEASSIGDCSVT